MKIVVCSLYINKWYREVVKYGRKTLEDYCQKYGYDFMYETEETKDGVYDGERDIPWYKIKLMLKIMETSDADFIVWNDADSVIVRDDIRMDHLIQIYLGDKDVLVARDWKSVLNTGTMFIRNCQYSKDLLRAVWDNKETFDVTLHEQASLGEIYERNHMDAQNHIVVLPLHLQNIFLTYWYSYYPDAFIFHSTRCAHDPAGFLFTIDMFLPIKMDEETDDEYRTRVEWMKNTELCRTDIDSYLKGGERKLFSARYTKYLNGQYQLE